MGLDLYHLKATLHPEDPGEATAFREDEFDDFALDVLDFRRFIQVIPDTDYPTRIVIVKDEESLSVLRANGWESAMDKGGVVLLLGEPADLVREVERAEAANGWDPVECMTVMSFHWRSTRAGIGRALSMVRNDRALAKLTWEMPDGIRKEFERDPWESNPPAPSLAISYPAPADFRGLYAEEIGYQRKGMSSEFYKEFRATSHHVLRSDVVRAARYLDATGDPAEDRQRRDHFHDQFLAGFEEGTSIFEVSY